MARPRKQWEEAVVKAAQDFSKRTVSLNTDRMAAARVQGLVVPFPVEFLENVRAGLGDVACGVLDALEPTE